jgi:hypothetical protein
MKTHLKASFQILHLNLKERVTQGCWLAKNDNYYWFIQTKTIILIITFYFSTQMLNIINLQKTTIF